jgi:hypothetical protein
VVLVAGVVAAQAFTVGASRYLQVAASVVKGLTVGYRQQAAAAAAVGLAPSVQLRPVTQGAPVAQVPLQVLLDLALPGVAVVAVARSILAALPVLVVVVLAPHRAQRAQGRPILVAAAAAQAPQVLPVRVAQELLS